MQALVLLVGYVCGAVALALGYALLPALFVLATALTIVALRAHDRRRHG